MLRREELISNILLSLQVGGHEHILVSLVLEEGLIVHRISGQGEHALEVTLAKELLVQVHQHLHFVLSQLLGAVELLLFPHLRVGH